MFDKVHAMLVQLQSGEADLSVRQALVLSHLHKVAGEAEHSVLDVAAALNFNKPSVTRALDALADAGFVTRTASQVDRRRVCAAITSKGKKFLAEVIKAAEAA